MWSVAKTRCPVSAAVIAAEIVSRSLISPTRITSGSSLNTLLKAFGKLLVSEPNSLWTTTLFLCLCRYSIGSSIVIICKLLVAFILSITDAKVVYFPVPVAPVTSTKPFSSSTILFITFGKPSSSKVGISHGITLKAAATVCL